MASPIIDNAVQPTPTPPSNEQRAFRLRLIAAQLRDELQGTLKKMKVVAQRGDGVAAVRSQLNSENAGDGNAFQEIYTDGRALLEKLDAAANADVGGLS